MATDPILLDSEPNDGKAYAKAWHASKKYIRWGIFWGLLLLASGHLLRWLIALIPPAGEPLYFYAGVRAFASILAFVADHLGAGFVVAAVAVYFYEWGAHAKKLVELVAYLRREGSKQRALTIKDARECLARCLNEILLVSSSRPQHGEAATVLRDLADTLGGLCSSASAIDQRFLKVVTDMAKEVQENAEALRTLDSAAENTFMVTAASVLADGILASQMSTLGSRVGVRDSYEVVSDFVSWRKGQAGGGGLLDLLEETERAVRRGAEVRRIFNLLHEGACSLQEEVALGILRNHLEYAEKRRSASGGRYEVACFGETQLAKVPENLRLAARGEHCGIFWQGGRHTRFEVKELDLSRIVVSRKEKLLKKDTELFREMWQAARASSLVYEPGQNEAQLERERVMYIDHVRQEMRLCRRVSVSTS